MTGKQLANSPVTVVYPQCSATAIHCKVYAD